MRMQELDMRQLEMDMKAITRVPDDPVGMEEYVGSDDWNNVHEVLARLTNLSYSGPAGQEQVAALRDRYWSGDRAELVTPCTYPSGLIADGLRTMHVKDELEARQVYVTDAEMHRDNALAALVNGYYVQVWQDEKIIPSEHANRYLVIEHHHPSDAAYEAGHTLNTRMDTIHYEKALDFFLKWAKASEDPEINYRLVAAFPYNPLSLFHDGSPLSGTGLLLARQDWAQETFGGKHQSHVSILQGIDLPVLVTTTHIARMDDQSGRLKFYNEQLKAVTAVTMLDKRAEFLKKQGKKTRKRNRRSL